ncbi:hypothetical protein GDO81_020919 [Engystomops pustulosus]|uniref:G-protein coupled receptors family 1 profile domain-containing protein n=1 Tax=Engystomops pustulosus TaxID=76066 RepID=A0AAV6ZQE2_ENGPU|nr:hypothetical protein GDO81_020919 [Engystomops pustulosus]
MRNISETSSIFIFLGVIEMERFWFLYATLGLVLYLNSSFLCFLILIVVWTEENLHEPMYIFIGNLVLNGIIVNSSFLPKLISDLLSGSRTISTAGCFLQAFIIHGCAGVELHTFTLMAYDRYLAISQPLRYVTLMTKQKVWKLIIANWTLAYVMVFVPIIMTSYLPLCGVDINNILCDNMSLVKLACGDTSLNNIVGAVQTYLLQISFLLVIIYCYFRTFLVCLKFSKVASQKATRTLVTHLVAFSTFMVSSLFITLRYRISSGSISASTHTLITITGIIIPVMVNPLIYGIGTEALKIKILQKFHKVKELF